MLLAMNVLGWFTLVLGFAGIFSLSVPKWMGLVVMAVGGLSMFAAWSHGRARPFEPLLASLLLLVVGIAALTTEARAWFPVLALTAAVAHLASAAGSTYKIYRHYHHEHSLWR